ncbi:MAG: hemerythrin domain-containing protein [Ideonella sp.]|jgi:hemerythrin-like domain-containing protein|nr:hemerythrin domain-containing protein [Ideonella sp.]
MSAQRYRASPDAVSAASASTGGEFRALDACHLEIANHLDRLQALVDRIGRDGVTTQAQHEAAEIESFFSATARSHHADEERHVFPPLLASADADMVQAVRRLQQDHGFIEENWIELSPQLRALAGGYHWYDLDELRHGVQVFIDLLRDHIELEESLIYPHAKAHWAEVFARRAQRRAEVGAG